VATISSKAQPTFLLEAVFRAFDVEHYDSLGHTELKTLFECSLEAQAVPVNDPWWIFMDLIVDNTLKVYDDVLVAESFCVCILTCIFTLTLACGAFCQEGNLSGTGRLSASEFFALLGKPENEAFLLKYFVVDLHVVLGE
jgi:hypothetical protein